MVVCLKLVVGQFIDLNVLVSATPGILQVFLLGMSFFTDMSNLGGLMFTDVGGQEGG